jgi:coiled-coil domain-containing protein 130
MSSLAAAKADNFYVPQDFDPARHRTLNAYHGVHALRGRALADGGLVVRFETPFDCVCARCGENVAKGVRFNADKRQAGQYHSTKIWRFEMRHHCGSVIVIQTDPENRDYAVLSGARRRAAPGGGAAGAGGAGGGEDDEEGGGAEARLRRLEEELLGAGPSDAVPRDMLVGRERPSAGAAAAGPMAALERGQIAARRAAERRSRLEALEESSAARHASGKGLSLNRALRDRMRAARSEERGLEDERRRMGVSEGVRLLPASAADGAEAAAALSAARRHGGDGAAGEQEEAARGRQRILSEHIFAQAAAGGAAGGVSRGGVAAALEAARLNSNNNNKKRRRHADERKEPPVPPRPPRPPAAAPAPARPAGAVASWAPPLARRRGGR